MPSIDALTDLHEAKIKTITMEAPEGYEFGHVVNAEIEMRVSQLQYTTNKEGEIIRTAVMVVEACHIKESYDPAVGPGSKPAVVGVVDDPIDDGPVDVAGAADEEEDEDLDEVPF